MTMLNSTFLRYEHVVGTVLTTLNAGSIVFTYELLHKTMTSLVFMDPSFQSISDGTVKISFGKPSSEASSSSAKDYRMKQLSYNRLSQRIFTLDKELMDIINNMTAITSGFAAKEVEIRKLKKQLKKIDNDLNRQQCPSPLPDNDPSEADPDLAYSSIQVSQSEPPLWTCDFDRYDPIDPTEYEPHYSPNQSQPAPNPVGPTPAWY
ncbi:hypothetical protein FNV43_RR11680 [Rhamnella rubrinervis]|uniref:Uncharacterized protein n=1 Tax=Rhamnella rubrinervis TaxID=2594499 RepID=A0A8K0H687_9ROSA|nr:hypothetical protein FNV43_RR11680 [Rhamnella rubrinervis]